MYKVIVDISPKYVHGTNGCHKYVFGSYSTKREAESVMDQINNTREIGVAAIEKTEY